MDRTEGSEGAKGSLSCGTSWMSCGTSSTSSPISLFSRKCTSTSVMPPPAGGRLPAEKIPMLAQISTFRTEYVQAPSLDHSIRSERHELRDMASLSRPGRFLVRLKTQAIWTHVNGWNNDAMLDHAREHETWWSDSGSVSGGDSCLWRIVDF